MPLGGGDYGRDELVWVDGVPFRKGPFGLYQDSRDERFVSFSGEISSPPLKPGNSLPPKPRPIRAFGRPTPYNPETGTYMPYGDPSQVAPFTILEVGDNALLVTDYEGQEMLIGKAWPFRSNEYDEVIFGPDPPTVDSVKYEATADRDIRFRVEAPTLPEEETFTEFLRPDYFVGEVILAGKRPNGFTVEVTSTDTLTDVKKGDHLLEWEEVNTAGRSWAELVGVQRAQVKLIGDNTLSVVLYDTDGVPGTESFEVSMPPGLRRADFDGATYDGATYAYVSLQERTADDGGGPTTQNIIPSYKLDGDIWIDSPIGGTGLTGVTLMDTNRGMRWWLES